MLLSQRMPDLNLEGEEKRHACSILLPHARVVISYESRRLDCRSLLLLRMSSYEEWCGKYQDCYQHAVQACEESVEAHGETSKETLRCKIGVLRALLQIRRVDEAQKVLEECKTIADRFPINRLEEVSEAETARKTASVVSSALEQDPGQKAAAFALYQEYDRAMVFDRFRASSNKEMEVDCLLSQASIAMDAGRLEVKRESVSSSITRFGSPRQGNAMFASCFLALS